jgi:hypothetical protein
MGMWTQRVVRIHFFAPWRKSSRAGLDAGLIRFQSLVAPEVGTAIDATVTLSDVRVWGSGSAGWALASSKQAWLETTGSVYTSVVWMLTATLVVTGLLALINLITALTEPGWRAGVSWEYACETCVDGGDPEVKACLATGSAPLNMCFLSWHAKLAFPFLVAGQVRPSVT